MAVLLKKYPAIPEATQDVAALLKTVQALRQAVMVLTGQANPNTGGLDDQLTDLRSTTGGINARFTQYIEVSTSNDRALAQRATTLEAEVVQQGEELIQTNARLTQVDKVYADKTSALAEQAITLEANYKRADNDIITNTNASLQEVSRTFADANSATASRVTNLEATAGDGNANGNIMFKVSAGPSGYIASYDLVLKANGASSGFSVLARDAGGGNIVSSIAFTTSQFTLFDPQRGVTPVFNYDGNVFRFNVPVELLGGQIQYRGTFNTWYAQDLQVNNPNGVSVYTYIRAGSSVDIFCDFDGQPQIAVPLNALMVLRIDRIGSGGDVLTLTDRAIPFYVAGNSDNIAKYSVYRAITFQDNPPPGNWTYRVQNVFQGHGPLSIRVNESFR